MSEFSLKSWIVDFIGSPAHKSYCEYREELVKGEVAIVRRPGLPQAESEYSKGAADAFERDIFQEMLDKLNQKQVEEPSE